MGLYRYCYFKSFRVTLEIVRFSPFRYFEAMNFSEQLRLENEFSFFLGFERLKIPDIVTRNDSIFVLFLLFFVLDDPQHLRNALYVVDYFFLDEIEAHSQESNSK